MIAGQIRHTRGFLHHQAMHLATDAWDAIGVERGNMYQVTVASLNSLTEKDENTELQSKIKEKIEKTKESYNIVNTNEACKNILAISQLANKYFQENEPWKLIKENKEQAHKVLTNCAHIARDLSILISPVRPKFSKELQSQLNQKNLSWKDLGENLTISKVGIPLSSN